MPPLDAGSLLGVVSEDFPAGPNLEFDPDFGALERAAQGKPEQQYGGTIIPAEEPDWKDVARQADALLERTRDLRVLGQLAVARLHISGLPAFAEVVAMTQQLLEARWDEIHPQLDPEEDNDPTLRANAMLTLAHPGTVLRFIRTIPLAVSPRVGQISWRDAAIATGVIENPGLDKPPTETTVRAAFLDSDPARLEVLRAAAVSLTDSAAAICATFDARAGYGTSPDFEEFNKLLRDVARTIERFRPAPDAAPEAAEAEQASADTDVGSEVASTDAGAPPVARRAAAPVTAASLREITTRADAMLLLDLCIRYYQRYEPASPLSMLIERARGLADKSFLDIVRELAPDGVAQVINIVGARDEPARDE